MRHKFDTSKELLLQRHKQGVCLVRPSSSADAFCNRSLATLFDSSMHVYFFDQESRIVEANPPNLDITGHNSLRELLREKPWEFVDKKFRAHLSENSARVIFQASMVIAVESGIRDSDRRKFQTLSFKFPFYEEGEVVGLFGCSLKIDKNSLFQFGEGMSKLILSGLLNDVPLPERQLIPAIQKEDRVFSQREKEVLVELIRGKTAKSIGMSLQISKRTVENHVKNLKAKSRCSSKSELINKYIDQLFQPQ